MAKFKTITREQLKEKMDNQADIVLIDTLGDESYQNSHLPKAISMDAHKDDFVEQAEKLIQDKTKEIVVYCASFSCQLSTSAAGKLADAGYSNVADFEGGLQDWAEAGYDLEGDKAEELKASLSQAESKK